MTTGVFSRTKSVFERFILVDLEVHVNISDDLELVEEKEFLEITLLFVLVKEERKKRRMTLLSECKQSVKVEESSTAVQQCI